MQNQCYFGCIYNEKIISRNIIRFASVNPSPNLSSEAEITALSIEGEGGCIVGQGNRLLQGQKAKNSRCFGKLTPKPVINNFGSLMLINVALLLAEWLEHSRELSIHFENVFDFSCE